MALFARLNKAFWSTIEWLGCALPPHRVPTPAPVLTVWATHARSSMLAHAGWAPRDAKVLVLGLDNAGKTTIMGLMVHNVIRQNPPTGHACASPHHTVSLGKTHSSHAARWWAPRPVPDSEELRLPGNVRVKAFDMGGQVAARKVWRTYFAKVDGIIYMVDSTDHERFKESRVELQVRTRAAAAREQWHIDVTGVWDPGDSLL